MSPNFGNAPATLLAGYDGNAYALYKRTWELKLSRPERSHVEHNYDKLVQTLKSPDEVRRSTQHKDCFIAYKKFDNYWVVPGVSAPTPPGLKYFAVVCDAKRNVIKTFFPARTMKEGKKLWPT